MDNIFVIASIVIKELVRRKDAYVLLIITVLLTVMSGSVNFFGDLKMVRYMKELCLLLVWISSIVIAVTLAARQIHAERESRTLFSLLAKPVSRDQLVLGKFLGCWLACGMALLVFYLFFVVTAFSRGEPWRLAEHFQAFWMHWIMLGIIVAMVLCGSLVFTAPSSNATICFAVILSILMLGRHLGKLAMHMGEPTQSLTLAVFYAIPHFEFYDLRDLIIHDWPMVKWSAIGIATLYGMAYAGAFLGVACFLFRRKPLNA
ncbi:MAG TPA: ABC transporter permease subunit [Candidatus Acidoferrum sp.]|nr:ABC transporter permease subunit [Candidatus Acidoferrum sp.]